jgi:hypothetical protein
MIVIIRLERGIPSKCESSARADYVPALCTHRPSLLPIEWSGENVGSRACRLHGQLVREKLFKPYHLEEGEVVTRFP